MGREEFSADCRSDGLLQRDGLLVVGVSCGLVCLVHGRCVGTEKVGSWDWSGGSVGNLQF